MDDPEEGTPLIEQSSNAKADGSSSDSAGSDASLAFESRRKRRLNYAYHLLDEALEEIGVGRFQYQLVAVSSFGQFVDAVETVLLSLILPALAEDWKTSEDSLAVVASLTAVGMMLGAFGFGKLSDVSGRRFAYRSSLALCTTFGLLSSFATNEAIFTTLRFFLGVGYGGNLVTATTLMVEFTPNAKRGLFMTIGGLAYGLGALFVTLLAWAVVPKIGWRWLIRIASFVSMPVLLMLAYVPESARFYVMSGRYEEAVQAVRVIARRNNRPIPKNFSLEALTALHLDRHEAHADSWRNLYGTTHLFAKKSYVESVSPLFVVWFLNSFASTIFVFAPMEVQNSVASDSTKDTMVYSVGLVFAFGGLFGTLVTAVLITKLKRRLLLTTSTLACGFFVLWMGLGKSPAAILSVAFFTEAAAQIAISVLYVYTPEVFPTHVRTTAFGVCMIAHRVAPAVAPYVIAALDSVSFEATTTTFGIIWMAASLFSLLLTVETFDAPLVEEKLDAEISVEKPFLVRTYGFRVATSCCRRRSKPSSAEL